MTRITATCPCRNSTSTPLIYPAKNTAYWCKPRHYIQEQPGDYRRRQVPGKTPTEDAVHLE